MSRWISSDAKTDISWIKKKNGKGEHPESEWEKVNIEPHHHHPQF